MIVQQLPSPSRLECANDPAAVGVTQLTELDARAPTPPNHLKAILAALATLPIGQPQCVRTKAQPGPLLQSLAAHGVIGESHELPDGSWRTTLRREAVVSP